MTLANIADGLQMYSRLEEASGTRVDAWSFKDLVDINTVGQTTGKIGNAADFVRTNSEHLDAANSGVHDFGDEDFTLAFWAKLTTKDLPAQNIVGKFEHNLARQYLADYRGDVTDRFRFIVDSDGVGGTAVAVADNFGSPTTGVLVFIVCWHDATANTINIQVNNGTPNSTAHSAGVFQGSAIFSIGASQQPAGVPALFFDGAVDEVLVYDRVLITAERTSLWNGGAGVNAQTTLALEATPTAPSALSVGTPTTSSLTLNWTDNSTNEAAFEVERALAIGGPFSKVVDISAQTGTGGVSFIDVGLDPGVEYFYRIRAVNPTGNSAFTTIESATTLVVPEDIKTVIPAGGGDFLTLLSWESSEDRDITAAGSDVVAVAECSGGSLFAGSQQMIVSGWTVDRFHYIEIRNASGSHQDGTPFDSVGPFVSEAGPTPGIVATMQVNQAFFRMKGIMFTSRNDNGRAILINNTDESGHYRFEECLLAVDTTFQGHPSQPFIIDFLSNGVSPATEGCGGSGPDGPNLIRNCVFYMDKGEGSADGGPHSVLCPNGDLTQVTVHNCTFIQFLSTGTLGANGESSILNQGTGTIVEENNYFRPTGAGTVYSPGATGPLTKGVTSATSNTEAVTVGLQNVTFDYSNFQGPKIGTALVNLRLVGSSALAAAGADLTGVGITVDNTGAARVAPHNIGAYNTSSTVAPTVPTDLVATPVSTTQIDLAWNDVATDEEAYEVHRSTTGIGGPYTLLTTLPAGTTAHSDTGLPIGTEFCYRVRATAGALLLNLEAAYGMEEGTGNSRLDLTGNGNDLVSGTAVGDRGGLIGIAPDFRGSPFNERLFRGSTPDLVFGDEDMTVVAWGLFDTAASGGIVAKWGSGTLEYLLQNNSGAGRLEFIIADTGVSVGATAQSDTFGTVTTGSYLLIIGDHDSVNDEVGIEVNQTGRDSVAYALGINSSTSAFEIGARANALFFNGGIDEILIYRRQLTTFERTALFNGGAGLPFSQLAAVGLSGFSNDSCATTLSPTTTNAEIDNVLVESAGWREGRFSGSVSVRAAADNIAGYLRQNIQPTDDSSSASPLGSPGGDSDDLTTRRVRNYYTIPPAAWWQQYRLRMDMSESALNRKEDGFRYYLRLYKHLQTLRFDGPCITEGDLLGRSFIHPNNPSADEDIRWPGVVSLNAIQLQFRWLPNFGCVDIRDTDLELMRLEIDASNFLSLKVLAGDPTQREYNQHDVHGPHEPTLRLSKTRLGSEVASVDLVTYWGYDLREPSLERLDDVLLLTIQHNTVGLSLRVDKYGGFGEKRTADDLTAFAGNGLGDIVYNGSGYYGPPVVVDENVDRAIDGVRRRVRSSRPDLARRFFVQERNMVAAGERDTTSGQRVSDQPFLLEEDFSRSDDANLGSDWDIIRQTGNGFNIVSNKASCTDDGFERWDSSPRHRDYVVEADVAVAADADLVGVIGRYPNEFFNSDFASSPTVGGGIGMELVQLTPSSAELRLVAWWLDERGLTYDTTALSSYTAGVEYRMQLTLSGSTITGTIAEIGTGTVLATVSGTSTLFPKPGRIVIYGEAPTSPVTINRIVAIPSFVTDLT